MIEFNKVLAAYKAIADGIGALAGVRDKRRRAYDEALLRVYTATSESRSYIAGLKNRKQPDSERETRIARLWSEAAVSLRKIDKKLADQCLLFGSAIAESTDWRPKQIDAARRAVIRLFEQARKLL